RCSLLISVSAPIAVSAMRCFYPFSHQYQFLCWRGDVGEGEHFPASVFAREAGEAEPVGRADCPHIRRGEAPWARGGAGGKVPSLSRPVSSSGLMTSCCHSLVLRLMMPHEALASLRGRREAAS